MQNDYLIEKCDLKIRLCDIIDANFILSLRLDSKLNRYVSYVEDDINGQIKWIKEYKNREEKQQEFYFIIEDNHNNKWGTYRIYNINNESFTIGSWLFKRNSPNFISIKTDIIIKEFAFEKYPYAVCLFDIRKNNKNVIRYHNMFSPKIINEDKNNYYYQLSKMDFYINKLKVLNYFGII